MIKNEDTFFLKIAIYVQWVCICLLSMALWFLIIGMEHEMANVNASIESNTRTIENMYLELSKTNEINEKWQDQMIKSIKRAIETGAW